jgi:hypothetical protein
MEDMGKIHMIREKGSRGRYVTWIRFGNGEFDFSLETGAINIFFHQVLILH